MHFNHIPERYLNAQGIMGHLRVVVQHAIQTILLVYNETREEYDIQCKNCGDAVEVGEHENQGNAADRVISDHRNEADGLARIHTDYLMLVGDVQIARPKIINGWPADNQQSVDQVQRLERDEHVFGVLRTHRRPVAVVLFVYFCQYAALCNNHFAVPHEKDEFE